MSVLARYVFGTGLYPADIAVNTPAGVISPTAFSAHDVVTVIEAFARVDYPLHPNARVVVDIGSNIGITALYFLTRHPDVRVYLYEPVEANCERLLHNLRDFRGRFTLTRSAVSDEDGPVRFRQEPTGRYGRIAHDADWNSMVEAVHINTVLQDVLSREGRIDVLKIDTEGHEIRTVQAAARSKLAFVERIYMEASPKTPLVPELFVQQSDHAICRLVRRPRSIAPN